MKLKNRHGRVGVKKPLSGEQRRKAFLDGFKRGGAAMEARLLGQIASAKSLRDLKKEVGL